MADNKKDDHNQGVNPVAAGVAGAVIGAGVAVAATKILSDEETRNKIMDKAKDIRDQVKERVDNMRESAAEQIEPAKEDSKAEDTKDSKKKDDK